MSAFTEGLCPAIQQSLIDLYDGNFQTKLRSQIGYTKALLSPENRANIQVIPLSVNGKIKKVQLVWTQRLCEDNFSTTKPANCTPTVEPTPSELILDGFTPIYSEWIKFSEDNLRKLCEGDEVYKMNFIKQAFEPFFSYMNKLLLAEQVINFGNWGDGSPNAESFTMITSAGAPNFEGETDLMLKLSEVNFTEKPIVVGAGNMYKYAMMTKIGCCNDGGIDMSQAGMMNFYLDHDVTTQVGTNHFVALAPGLVQLVTFNENVGTYRKVNDVFVHDVITDPFTGLDIDLNIRYDDCAREWAMQIGTNYKLVYLPSETFSYCDKLSGVNFTFDGIALHA